MSVEAFEATNEELKAANEEVTSVNEELQSANEELETSKEELQSPNEELVTVNGQLQTKVLDLEALTNDLDNLLSSTDIAVVFLDRELNVRRFTPAIQDLLQLIPADIGRPLTHLAQKFTDGDLISDAHQVIAKLAPLESEVLSHSGRWYLRRTLPYRTEDNRIDGAVITFVDITARKQAEQAIEAERARLQAVLEQMPAAVLLVEAPSGKLQLEGTITAHSEGEGRGATFTVHLPLERRFTAPAAATQPPGKPDADALQGSDVLLVEDDAMTRESTRRLLEQYGAAVRAVSSAALAREAFERHRPDVVVADIAMPDEDGYALITQLRRLEEGQGTARVPALALTAFARSTDRERALAAGFDAHVTKPVDSDELVRVLQWMRADKKKSCAPATS